ncbi:MAG: hypothetical protein QXX64_05750 [Nitrososphaera sp.]|uniref:Zinc finger C2H2 domain-containing protein n=1 Tax=Nitrososphaera gargensis (strain Ga9.2) TaxID=1237085 RepID=K0IF94_NITGG|nr:zinc finger C2H2 domain-containing protein [Candidatus Nitrososphaera gargensis]AFU57493.1 zinc finger C2H2 domain-containing protein [Candidatus Nitrososphaera gargensis Ga9.2]
MAIERCDKCGKSFMSKSEVERHKMWEHPVPVSPFEERPAAAVNNNNGINPDEVHKLTSDVMAGTRSKGSSAIGSGQRRRVPFRT